jgi:titin
MATAGGQDRIELTWTDVGGETGYALQRSTDGGATWGTIVTTGQDVTAASDSGLAPGTTYWYRVVASNAAGDSTPSNTESATTDEPPGSADPGPGTDLGSEPGSTV